MIALAAERTLQVRRSIEEDNLLCDLQASKIKAICHDKMDTALLAIATLDNSAPAGTKKGLVRPHALVPSGRIHKKGLVRPRALVAPGHHYP